MANEALNPFQQFKDDGNRELARGSIEFFENGQEVTQLIIYSDSDLTQVQANPYELDDYGRIRGDVHYEGQATLVVYNAAGLRIRRLDDVVSTNDGNLGGITLNRDSVAAMVSDDALTAGQIVATRGYYAGNLYGGARYEIVEPGDETPDDYLVHVLGNGLRAILLDQERHNDFLVAGARGDGGSDDTDAMQAVINQGGEIEVPEGYTFMATNLRIPRNVRFVGGGAIRQLGASSGDLLQITSREVTEVKFRDVILDGNQIQGNDGNATVGVVLSA